jgi:ATP-dependent DNA helicase RecG
MNPVNAESVKTLIAQGENLYVEFKQSRDSLSRSVFETICAFLNRKGGHILLGVRDDGVIDNRFIYTKTDGIHRKPHFPIYEYG